MRIFQLKNKVDGYATINFGDIDMMNVLRTGNVSVLNGQNFVWNKTIDSGISDCPFFIGAMPIFASDKIRDIFDHLDCKTATFMVEGISYTIIAASPIVGKSINIEQSKCKTFRSGKIMEVKEYTFCKRDSFPEIFTIEEYMMHTFCNEEVIKLLNSCHLNHLVIKECSIH
jgi:hypothetical protein